MAVGQLDFLSYLLLTDALQRSLYVTAAAVPAALASLVLKHRLPLLQMVLWALVLLRAVLPTGYALPFSLREWLAPLAPDLFGFIELRLRLWDWGFAVASPPVVQALPWLTWQVGLVLAWCAVTFMLLLRFFAVRRRYRRILRAADPLMEPAIQQAITRWRRALGIRRRVELRAGRAAVSPFTMGVLVPKVYLPRRLLLHSDRNEVDAILGHELAHVRRYDDLWLLLQGILCAVFFFLPPIHMAARQLTRQRELLSDQLAVSRGGLSAHAYASSLLSVIRRTLPSDHAAVPAHLTGDAAFCSARIRAVADAAREGMRGFAASIVVLVFAIVFVMPMRPHETGLEAQAAKFLERTANVTPDENPGLLLPIEGAHIGEGFRVVPRPERRSYRYHTGLDLHAPVGSPIRAMADGTVERVIEGAGDRLGARTGGYIVLSHGALRAYYTYLRAPTVRVGDRVAAGEVLGHLGRPPFSPEGKGTHLHLEITIRGRSIDPLAVLASDP